IRKNCASSSSRCSKTPTIDDIFSENLAAAKRHAQKRSNRHCIGSLWFALVMFTNLPDQLILFPTTNPINPRGAVRRMIPFENGTLEIWTARSRLAQQQDWPEAYALRFYGNADRADGWVSLEAEMWNERAIEIWGMNYPGFGGSTGPARLKSIAPAALAAFDELQRQANGRPIVLFGASIGTAPALHIAANRQVDGLV